MPAAGARTTRRAAPVTVDLRIEGKTKTLYEGTVTTDVRTVDLGDGTGSHACDGTANPATPVPGPTRGAAFMTAAQGPGGFTFTGTYTFDMGFTVIAGDNVGFDPGTGEFLAEYKNGQFASFGSCGDQVATGDKVLYAYATGSEQLLELSGPATVAPGAPATFKVTDAGDGGRCRGRDGRRPDDRRRRQRPGHARRRGPGIVQGIKERRDPLQRRRRLRDDRLRWGVRHAPAGGRAPRRLAAAVRDERPRRALRDARRAPRRRQGFAGSPRASASPPARARASWRSPPPADPSGLLAVKLRLTRNDRGRCSTFSGKSERFRHVKCGASNGFWFGVGDRTETSYLLPSRLPRGRYVLDVNAIDKAYNRDDARRRGGNRIVFHVG